MDQELRTILTLQQQKIDTILASVEKTRKHARLVTWITILTLVVPMIGLALFGPAIVNSYISQLNGSQQVEQQ